MVSSMQLLLGFYAVIVPLWLAVSVLLSQRRTEWDFTPRWHQLGVPVFRVVFIVSMPIEFLMAEHVFHAGIFVVGAVGALAWLVLRARYILTAEQPFTARDSVRYNIYYVANLMAFAIAMHSFVCLAIMINVSITALLVRQHYFAAMYPLHQQGKLGSE